MIYRHFYELHWSLHMRDSPRFSSYAVTCVLLCTFPSFPILHSKCSALSPSLVVYPTIRICTDYTPACKKKKKIWNKIYLFDYNTKRKKINFTKIEIIYKIWIISVCVIYIVCYIVTQRKYQISTMLRNKMFCAQEFQQNCIRDRNIRIRSSLRTMRYAVLNFRRTVEATGTGRRNEKSDRLARLTVTDEEYKLQKWCILKNDISNKWRHPLCPQATFVPGGIVISRE